MNTTAKRITGAATAVTIALAATMFAIIIPASNADTSTSTERVLVGKAEPRVTGGITPSKPPVKSEPEKEAPAPQPEQSEPAPTTPEPTTPPAVEPAPAPPVVAPAPAPKPVEPAPAPVTPAPAPKPVAVITPAPAPAPTTHTVASMTAKFLAAAAAQGKTTGDINASRCIAKQFGTVSGGSTTAPSFNTPNGSWAALSMTASGSNFAFVWYACG